MKIFLLGLGFLLTVILSFSPAIGQHAGHQMPAPSGEKKEGAPPGSEESPSRAFLLEGNIKASFSIMPMEAHKRMLKDMKMKVELDPQATHNIAVTLTDTRSNLPISDCGGQDESHRPERERASKTAGLHDGHESILGGF